MVRSILLVLLAWLCVFAGASTPAHAFKDIDGMSAIDSTVQALASKYGARRVLVVFDIDNTLLTARQDLGSDAWFGWQAGLLNSKQATDLRVAGDFPGLLAVQGLLFSVSDMRPTEQDVAERIDGYEGRGHPVMALTARGPDVRSATLRELRDAGVAFDHHPVCGPPLCVMRGTVPRGQVLSAAREVFSDNEIRSLNLETPRPVSVAEGVMMVAGQNKGAMLRLLLASAPGPSPLAIVFVDDGLKNVKNMEAAFAGSPIEVAAFHYIRFEPDVKAFLADPERQRAADAAWDRLSTALCANVETWCAE